MVSERRDAVRRLTAVTDLFEEELGRPPTLGELLEILGASVPTGRDVASLQAEPRKKAVRVRRGDVVAIPGGGGDYHLAVVVARDRFGTALGVLHGTSRLPKVDGPDRCQARSRPVDTDESLIADGTWPVVDHREDLLSLFPAEPEIYHSPDLLLPGEPVGEFGSAESASGRTRDISRQEAEEVGLLSGSYRQVHLSSDLQALLDAQA